MWPEHNCIIIYKCSKCNVKLVWFKMRQQNFVVCEPNFTNISAFDVESIVVVNAFLPFIDIIIPTRDIRSQSPKLSKKVRTVNVE